MNFKRMGLYGLVALLLLVTGLAALNRKDQTVGFSQEIQYDDFAFSVVGVRKAQQLGDERTLVQARGVFYIVNLKVANHAKRVAFTFDNKVAVLVDDAGREYRVSAAGQAALEAEQVAGSLCSGPLAAGASCTKELVFEVPTQTKDAHLRISWGGAFVDLLDIMFCGDKRISLESQATSQQRTGEKK